MPLTKALTSKREIEQRSPEDEPSRFALALGAKRKKKLRGGQEVPMDLAAVDAALTAANS